MRRFRELFELTNETRIIDVGGYEFNWTLIDDEPSVLLVNLEDEAWKRGRFEKVSGDGRRLDYADASFDIAYSNSVIEHVGGAEDRARFAREIRRVGKSYYLQTPNKNFFVEPHMFAAGIHLLPPRVARRLVRPLSLWGWVERPSQEQVDQYLAALHLLDERELRGLFPEAEIIHESFMGMTKSLIAVHRAR